MPQDEKDHTTVCVGAVLQCLTCGGRMCDCGSEGLDYQIFYCIHCGETEVEERERAGALALSDHS
jgi:hypothetical protein